MRPPIFTTAPSGCLDTGEDAGHGRFDLDHRLVGLDLGDELAGLDAFAFLLGPAHDLAFADGEVAEGHGDRLAVDRRLGEGRGRAWRWRDRRRGAGGGAAGMTAALPPEAERQCQGTGGRPSTQPRAASAILSASTSMARSSDGARGWLSGSVWRRRDRRVELVEGELVHRLAELGADAAHRPAFVDDEQPVGLGRRSARRSRRRAA